MSASHQERSRADRQLSGQTAAPEADVPGESLPSHYLRPSQDPVRPLHEGGLCSV